MFGLAADGKTNKKGMPNPLRLAVIANAHFDTVQLPFPPALIQKLGLAHGRTARPHARLPAHVRARRRRARRARDLSMKQKLIIAALFLALLLLAGLGMVLRRFDGA